MSASTIAECLDTLAWLGDLFADMESLTDKEKVLVRIDAVLDRYIELREEGVQA